MWLLAVCCLLWSSLAFFHVTSYPLPWLLGFLYASAKFPGKWGKVFKHLKGRLRLAHHDYCLTLLDKVYGHMVKPGSTLHERSCTVTLLEGETWIIVVILMINLHQSDCWKWGMHNLSNLDWYVIALIILGFFFFLNNLFFPPLYPASS